MNEQHPHDRDIFYVESFQPKTPEERIGVLRTLIARLPSESQRANYGGVLEALALDVIELQNRVSSLRNCTAGYGMIG